MDGRAPCLAASSAALFLLSRVRLEDLVVERREKLTPSRWPDFVFCHLGAWRMSPARPVCWRTFRPERTPGAERQRVFRQGDVLYGRLRPYLNKVYLAEGEVHTGICSGEFFVLTARLDRVLPLFLRQLLASSPIADAVKGMQFGSALPRLQLKDLLKLQVPLPPLRVQAKVEEGLRQDRERLRQHGLAFRRGGATMRKAFEASLASGAPYAARQLAGPGDEQAYPNALPSDYVATVRGRRIVRTPIRACAGEVMNAGRTAAATSTACEAGASRLPLLLAGAALRLLHPGPAGHAAQAGLLARRDRPGLAAHRAVGPEVRLGAARGPLFAARPGAAQVVDRAAPAGRGRRCWPLASVDPGEAR